MVRMRGCHIPFKSWPWASTKTVTSQKGSISQLITGLGNIRLKNLGLFSLSGIFGLFTGYVIKFKSRR